MPNPSESCPDLEFGPDVTVTGFTPAGISAFSDLRSAAVVRELIQNSLDAALIEANENCARIRFRRFTCTPSQIPGIESYRNAFKLAKKTHTWSGKREMPSQALLVSDRIESALNEKKLAVLSVIDNGVGLDGQRMSALLSDGISAKSGSSAGTYGNGHSVAIPASNLRYILYGGITKRGATLASGHAVLASHKKPGETLARSAHGQFVKSLESPAEGVHATFPSGQSVPPVIKFEIDHIRNEYGHGTAVIIPAFNNFEDDNSLWEIIFRAAACNFFQAIHVGQLIVEVEDIVGGAQSSLKGKSVKVLNANSLPEILQKYRDERRNRPRGAFLSGGRANEAFRTLTDGEKRSVKTSEGCVSISLLLCNDGKHSVGLCRNGMWISSNLPMFYSSNYNDRQPFQALILLDPAKRNGFYRLVQEAETPLHNELALKPMPPNHRRALQKAFGEIRDWIRDNVPEAKTKSYSPDDIFAFQFNDVAAQQPGGVRRSFWGSPAATAIRPSPRTDQSSSSVDGPGSSLGTDVPSNSKPFKRKETVRRAAAPCFQIMSIPDGDSKRRILVKCENDCNNAELRIFLDENVDVTCDRQFMSQMTPLYLADVFVNEKPVSGRDLINGDEGIVGINLGNLTAASELLVETSFTIPDGEVCVLPGNGPALRIEVTRRVETARKPAVEAGDLGVSPVA